MLITNQKITVGFTMMIGIIATLAFVGYKEKEENSRHITMSDRLLHY